MRPFLTLYHPAVAETYYAQGLWPKDTFYSLLREHAPRAPEALDLRNGRVRLSWRALLVAGSASASVSR